MTDTATDTANHSPATPAPHRPARRRWLRALLWTVSALVLLLAVVVVLIATFDWNRAKPWVNERVSESTGRHFAIEGDLRLRWTWPQPLDQGWRHWVPGVTIEAEQLALGQPEGWQVEQEPVKGSAELPALPAPPDQLNKGRLPEEKAKEQPKGKAKDKDEGKDKDSQASPSAPKIDSDSIVLADEKMAPPPRDAATMATAARATASLRLWPLLGRHVLLDHLQLEGPDLVFARRKDGSNNWTFKRPEHTGPRWRFQVAQLSLRGGLVGWSDGVRQMAVRARLDSLVQPPSPDFPYGMRVGLTGRIAKATVEAQGLIGPVLDLQSEQARFPVKLWAHAGSLRARAEGILDNPRALKGMDLQVRLRGSSMADLFPLTGLLLPRTPPFDTNGHLVGSLEPGRAVWDYEEFDGRVGQSDLRGTLHYASGKPRPKLSGDLASRKLRLADLGPVVGAPSTKQGQKTRQAASGKALPTQRFDTSKWNAMDMDVRFKSDRIERPQALPIEDFSVHAVMDNGVLRLSPLRFGMAKGRLDIEAVVDSGAKPPKASLQGKVQGLQLSALFPEIELMKKSLGSMDGALGLEGRGQSIAEWLGTSSGDIRLYVRDGRFSKQLLDLAALNLGSVIVTKLFGADKEVQLNCAVADLTVKQGIARTRNVKLATPEAIIEATGQISLAQETMDLRIVPESLKWKFFSLRTPLYVRGSFANPKVGVEPGPLLLRAGAAVAAAVVAPAALALVPLTVPAAEEDAQCQRLLAESSKK
ncbi:MULTISPECIES: AsmA family protein [unclassified Delftia]|uniref:AsmA family protein n=1 Tax=unclassified Delftia TaxID=2613839 RepID=UPI001902A133|nr:MULTISPECIES: AsmA family protein [unclassified Delftia]MBK0112988.1 AsmA family protein [Delftia sp. S65]MBK0118194.1 AsmA family protein [Delftia sp. S67]MBK0129314.1 AsmA family protein [Delftia sp. S66]